jgi:tetratricopeptide (TPR) repeat protein
MAVPKRTISKQINSLFEKEEWAEARDVLEKQLAKHPDDHWLLTRIGTTFYEEGDYQRAMFYAEKAMAIAPRCPLVLWDYAGTLDMLGEYKKAFDVYARILKLWPAITKDECSEGEDWALSLLADVMFRVGVCFGNLGKKDPAWAMISGHRNLLDIGIASLYGYEDVQRELDALDFAPRKAVDGEIRHALELVEQGCAVPL